jgi:PAS domain S-box-containing protein
MNKQLIVLFLLSAIFCSIFSIELDSSSLLEQYSNSDIEERNSILSDLKENYLDYDSVAFFDLTDQLIKLTETPGLKAVLFNLQAEKYLTEDQINKAISYHLKAIQIVDELYPHLEQAEALFSLGLIFHDKQKAHKAIEYLKKAEIIYFELGLEESRADIIIYIGIQYENLIIYDEAMAQYLKALTIYEQIGNSWGIANAYVNIGNINQTMGNYDQALNYYSLASDIYKILQNDEGISDCLNNLGIVYSDLGQLQKALSNYLESLDHYRKLNNDLGLSITLNNLGIVYKELGDFDRSLESYQKSLSISTEINNTWGIANTLGNMGELLIDFDDPESGLEFLNQGQAISEQNNFLDLLMDSYKIFSKYYNYIEDYENAYKNYRHYVILKDSLIYESSKRITEIQAIHQNIKHTREIELLEIKQNLEDNIKLILIIGSVVLLIIVLWLLLLNNRKKKEIVKRKKLEKNILRLASIVNQAEVSIIMTDLEGKIIYVNDFTLKFSGFTADELIGRNPRIFKSDFTEEKTYQELWNTINTGQVWKGIFLNRKKNKEFYYEDAVIFPIKDENGKLINFAAVKKDITDQINTQNDLKTSEFRFRTMAEKINDGLMIFENDKIVYINDKFENITGYNLAELQKIDISDIISETDLEKVQQLYKEVIENPAENRDLELWLKPKEGDRVSILCGLTHHKIDQDNSAYYLVITNITDRKASEYKLLQSLNEKEVLIKEIHHRVKNNMQVISSLLQLQSRYIKDDEALDLFHKSQNRVRSMSLIHEKLYKSNDLAHIDFDDYIRNLTRNLLIFYGVDTNKIQVSFNISKLYLDIVQAIPTGLILNELLSNCLKYAFKGQEKGLINISMDSTASGYFLEISDNGVGIPAEKDPLESDSLGLQLVNSLTEQLHGNLELDRDNGTCFKLTFPPVTEKTNKN